MEAVNMFFFTSDEHYGHKKVLSYCNRPFDSVEEMNETLIARFNEKVTPQDVTVHAGDFCWHKKIDVNVIIKRLNGSHIFVKGSHDSWLPKSAKYMWRKMIEGQFVVVCHYAMRTWERSRYGSWQLYGHSHGNLLPEGKQYDVGVDNNNFYPISFEEIRDFMKMVGRKDENRILN
jgi:calcineurin-like phosphoesterase family protein